MHYRKRIRLAGFDYSASRHYFVTMCVEYRVHSFGFVENKSIQLSPNGIIAQEQWKWLENQYPYIELISFVIMPDHIHGIIFINADYYNGVNVEYDDNIDGNWIVVGDNNAGNGRNDAGNGRNDAGNGRDHSLHLIYLDGLKANLYLIKEAGN